MFQFTNPPKRKGLFGSQGVMPDYGTPSPPGGNPGDMTSAPKPGGGFFGEGGMGRGIAGTVGDFLLQQADMAPVYAPQMQLRQRAEQEQAQYQQRRTDEESDWMRRETWKRDNPAQGDPYRFEDNAGNGYERGADGQNKLVFTDPNDKVYMQDGQMISVPNAMRGGQSAMPQPASPSPAATDYLRQNPALKADFDAKYGPGSADRILRGGGVSNGTGGFPR